MTEPTSMGAYLRSARRRRRISIERAAEETRIRSDFILRMESDEFDFLSPTYVRGFLRSYARFLGIKPEPMLEEFDRRFGITRLEAGQIAAIERAPKSRGAPRGRRGFSSWAVAALLAGAVIVLLSVVGLLQGDDPPGSDLAGASSSPSTSAPPEASETPSPSPSPTETIALDDGITLEIVAANADCWVEVSSDGNPAADFSGTIPVGSSEEFAADETMTIILGNPPGVELVVNGTNIGTPGSDEPVTLTLPDDIDAI